MMRQTKNEDFVKTIIGLEICVIVILAWIYKICIYDYYKATVN